MDLNKQIEELDTLQQNIKPVLHDNIYYFLQGIKNILSSIYRASPFKVNDNVILTKTPVINEKERWGWIGGKHFLIKGAKAKVKLIDWDCRTDNYRYGLNFDEESYIHFKTEEIIPIEEKRLYYFGIDWIDAIEE